MTGRRLYDLFCDEHERRPQWSRDENLGLSQSLIAWPFLTHSERMMFNAIARRPKGVKR